MSCSGSHLGITINIKNTKFVKDLPMIDAPFRFIQCNSFREEYISVFSPYGSVLYTMTCGGSHLGFPIGIKNTHLVEDLQMIIPGQFGFNCPSGFREEAC
jgi:hypothetical protein